MTMSVVVIAEFGTEDHQKNSKKILKKI